MASDTAYRLAEIFRKSDYSLSAPGIRGVGLLETADIIRILQSEDVESVAEKLKDLHAHHPATVDMNRSMMERVCSKYNDNCDCFIPGIEEDCYCERLKKEHIETTNKRDYPEYHQWRNAVFERDDYTCQQCESRGGDLNAHHIKPYASPPKLRVSVDNGVTLCEKCHKAAHSKEVHDAATQ